MGRTACTCLVASIFAACGGAGASVRESDGSRVVSETTTPYDFHRAVAYTLLRTGQVARAEPHIGYLRRTRPNDPEPRVLEARAYMQEELWPEAHRALGDALRLAPRYAPAHAQLGVLLDMQGRHAEAEREHRRAIALDAGSPAYRNNLGYALYLQGHWSAAVVAYQAALARGTGNRRVHNNLGFAYAKLGKIDLAARHFRRAGGRAETANNLGLVHEERGETVRAYDAFYEAAQADPDMREARDNLQRVCEQLGRPIPALPEPEASEP